MLLELTTEFIKAQGIYNVSSVKLRAHLLTKLPPHRVPSTVTLWKVLRRTFSLRFRYTNLSKYRYRNPTYNEKRLFVSRLLSQFLHDGVVIVSVDETNIRSDATKGK